MKHVNEWIFVVSMVLCCSIARAQGTYVLTNETTSAEVIFTNSLGTATSDGTMIVFEGRLDSDIQVTATPGTTNNYDLAALRLLTQIKLFDELPVSNEVGAAQGAIAVLRDDTPQDATTGKFYAWGDNPGDSPDEGMTWVPLLTKDGGAPFSVADGSTNYITFVFNYTSNRYQVFVGEEPTAQVASAAVSIRPWMKGAKWRQPGCRRSHGVAPHRCRSPRQSALRRDGQRHPVHSGSRRVFRVRRSNTPK